MPNQRAIEIRVGIFVLAALTIFSAIVFTIGTRKSVFGSKTPFRAVFHNVGGLRPGGPVRIAGVDVGQVNSLTLRPDGQIEVSVGVDNAYARLVRADSRATVGSKGLLGDKLIDITVGANNTESIPANGEIPTDEPSDLGALMASATTMLGDARATVQNLRAATGVLADPEFQTDIKETTHNVRELTEMVANGNGVVRRVLTDEQLANQVSRTLDNVQVATGELARTSRGVRAVVDEVRTGNGSAHAILYGQDGVQLVRNLARTTGETASMLENIRTGDGTLHDLIYEDRADELLANVTQMSADLRGIVGDVRAGRGTIGGLLSDPSIYEDIKRLVGDLNRNEILRALVRYSIRQDEGGAPTPVTPGQ